MTDLRRRYADAQEESYSTHIEGVSESNDTQNQIIRIESPPYFWDTHDAEISGRSFS